MLYSDHIKDSSVTIGDIDPQKPQKCKKKIKIKIENCEPQSTFRTRPRRRPLPCLGGPP